MGWHIFGIIVGIVIYYIYRYSHEDSDDEKNESKDLIPNDETKNEHNQTEQKMMEEKPRTRELAIELLAKLGAELKEEEEDFFQFEYQGILFMMYAEDECLFVEMIWPSCYSFSKYDIDEFARVRQVVNEINMNGPVTVFYTITDYDEVAVHIKKNYLLTPDILYAEDYLRSIFNRFFKTARTLDVEIEKKRLQECTR